MLCYGLSSIFSVFAPKACTEIYKRWRWICAFTRELANQIGQHTMKDEWYVVVGLFRKPQVIHFKVLGRLFDARLICSAMMMMIMIMMTSDWWYVVWGSTLTTLFANHAPLRLPAYKALCLHHTQTSGSSNLGDTNSAVFTAKKNQCARLFLCVCLFFSAGVRLAVLTGFCNSA